MTPRATFALTIGLGLALAGCGPTASEPEPAGASKGTGDDTATTPNLGGMAKEKAGEGGMGGPPPGGGMMGGAPPKAAPPGAGEPKKEAAASVKLSDEEIAEIKKLPDPADAEAALAQKICAVGEDEDTKAPNHLGSMGVPIKEVVKGKTVYLCCKGCVEDLKADPDKYLAKIGK